MLTFRLRCALLARLALPLLLSVAAHAASDDTPLGETKVHGHRPTPCEKSPKDCVAPGGVPGGNNGGQGGNSGTGSTAGGRSGDPIREMDCPELARQIVAWSAKASAADKEAADAKTLVDAVLRLLATVDKQIQDGSARIAAANSDYERLKRLRTADCDARPGPKGKGNDAVCNNPGTEEIKALNALKSELARDTERQRFRSQTQRQFQEANDKLATALRTSKTFTDLVRRAQDERRAKRCPG